MSQSPNFTITIDTVKSLTDSNSIYLTGSVGGLPKTTPDNAYLLFAVGSGRDVSAGDANKYLYSTTYFLGNNTTYSTHLYHLNLNLAGLQSGAIAYVVAYPLCYNASEYTSYTDHSTGRQVYTSLGPPSAVLKVTIP